MKGDRIVLKRGLASVGKTYKKKCENDQRKFFTTYGASPRKSNNLLLKLSFKFGASTGSNSVSLRGYNLKFVYLLYSLLSTKRKKENENSNK